MKRITEAFYAVPHTIASRRDLTATAKLVWAYLRWREPDHGPAFPGLARIAADLGLYIGTVRDAVLALEHASPPLVEVQHTHGGRRKTNRYLTLTSAPNGGKIRPSAAPNGGETRPPDAPQQSENPTANPRKIHTGNGRKIHKEVKLCENKQLREREADPAAVAAPPEQAAAPGPTQPDSLPPPAPDSRAFRELLNSTDPEVSHMADTVRRLWLKQRPRQDAEALLARVIEDLGKRRYTMSDLDAYLDTMPLVAAPYWKLTEMIAEFVSWRDIDAPADADAPAAAGAPAPAGGAA